MRISSRLEPVRENLQVFFREVSDWLRFLSIYIHKKLVIIGNHFEEVKSAIVDLLLVKRGRYSRHFLNISFLFLVAGAVVAGPAIGEYNPSIRNDANYSDANSTYLLASNSQDEFSTATNPSNKPRFDILDYEVVSGDTLAGVADKFGISIDTIRWANTLKSDNLIPGQMLRIPPVTGIVEKVGPGDTIYSLAKKYKSDPQKIVNFPANDFADLDTFALNIGQTLFIPDGVMPEAAPVYIAQQVPQIISGGGGRFMWPTQGLITQYPVSYHMAVDIANPSAPPVAAGDDGTVSYANCVGGGYGCHIIIDHAGGFQTLYGHLQAFYIKAGDRVARGQVIGKMGSTGRSTGTHLHFEVRLNGILLNPLSYLK